MGCLIRPRGVGVLLLSLRRVELTPVLGCSGKVLDGPFDSVSAKRADDNTVESTFMKGGKEIRHIRGVVSKDGKTLRVTIKGTDAQGKTASGVLVLEKQ